MQCCCRVAIVVAATRRAKRTTCARWTRALLGGGCRRVCDGGTVGQRVRERVSMWQTTHAHTSPSWQSPSTSLRQEPRATANLALRSVSSLDSTNAADLPQPDHAIQSDPIVSVLELVGALPFWQGCPADCSSSQVLSVFYSFASRRRLCTLVFMLKSVDTFGCALTVLPATSVHGYRSYTSEILTKSVY
jgi:hypothetical protein